MRSGKSMFLILAAICMAVFVSNGCDSPASSSNNSGTSTNDAHDDHNHDDHDHDHSGHDHPAHGPNHGHIFHLDTDDYEGEWAKYSDTNVIRMFIVDAAGKKNVPVKVDSFTVTPKAGEEDIVFELEPEDADADGKTATFMLDDRDLSIAIPLGVDIEIKSGDQVWKGEIKAHEPLDH